MFLTRSLHPPGGATWPDRRDRREDPGAGVSYVLLPVLLNSLLLLSLGLLYNRLLGTPLSPMAAGGAQSPPDRGSSAERPARHRGHRLRPGKHGELLDISRQDLQELLQEAQLHACGRVARALPGCDVAGSRRHGADSVAMTAWHLLSHHQIKALPVADEEGRLVGIITLHDLMIDRAGRQPRVRAELERQLRVADR